MIRVSKSRIRWLLSKLGLLIDVCTKSYSEAKYHEAARAIERFLIDDLSQTYIPIIRSEMWEETEETKKRRQVIYSVLGVVFGQLRHVDASHRAVSDRLSCWKVLWSGGAS